MNIQHAQQTASMPLTSDSRATAEAKLWKRLCHHQLGVAFRRRKAVGSDRIDFFCPEAALVVCIDESDPGFGLRAGEDARLRRFGLETLRFTEEEVMFHTDRVVVEIFRYALSRTAHGEKQQA